MAKVRKAGVYTPTLYFIDDEARKIYMEYLGDHALTLKQFIFNLEGNYTHKVFDQIVLKVGEAIATLHNLDVIHGDLTTSNLMLKPK